MDITSQRDMVIEAYKLRYPLWRELNVTAITPDIAGGSLAAVEGLDERGKPVDEVCFIPRRGVVKIFGSTTELATYLQSGGAFRTWIFTGQGISALAFLATLTAVFYFTLAPPAHDNAVGSTGFDVLRQVLLLAAGYFFASQGRQRA